MIKNIKNPKFINTEQTIIDVEIKFFQHTDFLPYTAIISETDPLATEIFNRCINGEFGEVFPYEPQKPTRDEVIVNVTKKIIEKRDKHNYLGILVKDHWFPSSTLAQEHWIYLRTLASDIKASGQDTSVAMVDELGNPWRWKTLNNGEVDMTADLVFAITGRGATNQNTNFQNAKRHIVNLNASEHPEDYDFSDGWTEIYEG